MFSEEIHMMCPNVCPPACPCSGESPHENQNTILTTIQRLQKEVDNEFDEMKKIIHSPLPGQDIRGNLDKIYSLLNAIPPHGVEDLQRKLAWYKLAEQALNGVHWCAMGVFSVSGAAKLYFYASPPTTPIASLLETTANCSFYISSSFIAGGDSANKMLHISKEIKEIEGTLKEIQAKQIMNGTFKELKEQINELRRENSQGVNEAMTEFLKIIKAQGEREDSLREELKKAGKSEHTIERQVSRETRAALGLSLENCLLVASTLQPNSPLGKAVTSLNDASKALPSNDTPRTSPLSVRRKSRLTTFTMESGSSSASYGATLTYQAERSPAEEEFEKRRQVLHERVGFQLSKLPIKKNKIDRSTPLLQRITLPV
jgi:hypothetical protein